ncbi:demethylmenaquinone methyltransferase [Luteimicrobium xylanilyticum]|uniref:Demethylmenaquinone methyltransferase n=1 Tax=Luteimicrobium xylanilyticum TaxID=1133546 RepID=A0A5P9Q744_9MICO|nr:demethylmenaquinone methyltransferase [Luteimicrobium xylanilyticum]QFU97231.1 Demethylmenaquinone methyltransferase [Luteimicrobium xylanilyticum]
MPRASLDKDPDAVASMFDSIAGRYDLTNDVLSVGQDRRWRKATVRAVDAQPGERVLDLAAGTGTSSEPYANQGIQVVPCDFSVGMLQVGKKRSPDLSFVAGDATALPFADASFDAVTISFGLRNVTDTEGALREMLRVVRPGGRVVVCEFSTPTWPPFRKAYSEYLVKALPKVAGAITREGGSYDYLAESIEAWPDQVGLAKLMLRAGWEKVAYLNLTGGVVALHRGTRPA